MKNTKRRLLPWLLCLAICIASLSMPVLAEDEATPTSTPEPAMELEAAGESEQKDLPTAEATISNEQEAAEPSLVSESEPADSTETSEPTEEPASTQEAEPTEESAPTQEAEPTEEPASTQEAEPTEESAPTQEPEQDPDMSENDMLASIDASDDLPMEHLRRRRTVPPADATPAPLPTDQQEACDHELMRSMNVGTYEATCYAAGGTITVWSCKKCGAYMGEYRVPNPDLFPQKSHEFSKTETLENGCDGKIEIKICEKCGFVEKTTVKEGTQHVFETVVIPAEKCGEPSFTYQECTKCGLKMDGKYEYSNNIGTHTYTKKPIDVYRHPDCHSIGYARQECDCGDRVQYTYLEKTEHSFGDVQTTPATCAAAGETYQLCSICGDKKVLSTTPKLEHEPNLIEEKQPTCLEKGYKKYSCEKCGTEWTEWISAQGGHKFTSAEPYSDTLHWLKCELCGETSAENHDLTTTANKCTTTVSCATCGYTSVTEHHLKLQIAWKTDTQHEVWCAECGKHMGTENHTYEVSGGSCENGVFCSVCGVPLRTATNKHIFGDNQWVDAGDGQHHTRRCQVRGCNGATEEHSWSDGACTVCGAKAPEDVTATPEPTVEAEATAEPEVTEEPTVAPTEAAAEPEVTEEPTAMPTEAPVEPEATEEPTAAPTEAPAEPEATEEPTAAPTEVPAEPEATDEPTIAPTEAPVEPEAIEAPEMEVASDLRYADEPTAAPAVAAAPAISEKVWTVDESKLTFHEVTNAKVTADVPEGKIVLKVADIDEGSDAIAAISIAWEVNGVARPIEGSVHISMPLDLPE